MPRAGLIYDLTKCEILCSHHKQPLCQKNSKKKNDFNYLEKWLWSTRQILPTCYHYERKFKVAPILG